jgi:bacterial/archaeal transporter family-2 protein
MDRGLAVALTLLAGGLVAFQPPANAALARHVGDLGATFTSATVTFLIVAVIFVASGDVGQLKGLSEMRPEYLVGGLGGAVIVFISIVAVRSLGAGGVAAALVAGQLIVSVVLDRFGTLGLPHIALTPARIAGVVLLLAGTLLVTSR